MTKNTATMSSGVNWLGAAGVACAQASEIKPFMCAVRAAKRAALCHSVGRAPGCQENPGPGGQPTCPDGAAQRAQQLQVIVQVVDRVQPRAQDLVAAIQMAQVGTAVIATGITLTHRINRSQVLLVSAVADVD